MGSEYIGNGYGQSKAGGCVGGVGCLADVGCGGNACGAAACGANVCGVDGCGVAACGINACPLNGCVGDACAANFTPLPGPFSNSDNKYTEHKDILAKSMRLVLSLERVQL